MSNRFDIGQLVVLLPENKQAKVIFPCWEIDEIKYSIALIPEGQTLIVPASRLKAWKPEKPICFTKGYKHCGTPRGRYRVTVWPHPIEPGKYCYAASIGMGIMSGSGIPGHDTKFGSFADAESALKAGIEAVLKC